MVCSSICWGRATCHCLSGWPPGQIWQMMLSRSLSRDLYEYCLGYLVCRARKCWSCCWCSCMQVNSMDFVLDQESLADWDNTQAWHWCNHQACWNNGTVQGMLPRHLYHHMQWWAPWVFPFFKLRWFRQAMQAREVIHQNVLRSLIMAKCL